MATDGPSALYGDVLPYAVADFKRERAAASFSTDELSCLVNGGLTHREARRKVSRQMARLPWISKIGDEWADLSRPQRRVATVEAIAGLFRLFINDNGDSNLRNARVEMASLYLPDWVTRNGVHFGLFANAVSSQGSMEQQDEWMPKAMSLNIFGCFAMTELRGGSYLPGTH
jgi:acyl-CoA oxidase